MALTYNQFKALMKTMLVVDSEANTNFVAVLPSIIAYAEGRIYSEMDLITITANTERDCTPNNRAVVVPTTITIVHSAYVVTPAATTGDNGKRNPLQRVSPQFIDHVWPSMLSVGLPLYYALLTDTAMILAPTPDAAYKVGCIGPARPAALASGNPTTFLTTNLESLFVAAGMIFGLGWQRDFGAQADDPKAAVSWEMQYQTLKAAANMDELRRKAQAWDWQPFSPTPEAKQTRT